MLGAINKAFADRNHVRKFPQIVAYKKNSSEPILMENSEITAATLIDFASSKVGFYIRGPGNIESFDKITKKFCQSSAELRAEILLEAEEEFKKLSENEIIDGEYYIKVW